MTTATSATTVGCLPVPDRFGTYWLGSPLTGPAIMKASGAKNPNAGKYILLIGKGKFLFDGGGDFKYFDTPEDALKDVPQAAV